MAFKKDDHVAKGQALTFCIVIILFLNIWKTMKETILLGPLRTNVYHSLLGINK